MSWSDRSRSLDAWLRRELGRPVPVDPDARHRIMERVRAAAAGAPDAQAYPAAPPHRSRSGTSRIVQSSPWIGSALAAGLAALIATGSLRSSAEHVEALVSRQAANGDTVAGAIAGTIADTLRAVRFILSAPAASRVSLVGDFNRWDSRAMPLRADERGAWWAAVPLPDGWHRYAFVVDDTQWIADPAAAPGESHEGRRTSLIHVNEGHR